jgi:hypothetical protein
MSFKTAFGPVSARVFKSMLSADRAVFLRDNPNLQPVFNWLRLEGVRSASDIGDPEVREAFERVEFLREVRWTVDEKFWVIHFHNARPMEGDFDNAIPEYFEVFRRAISKPRLSDSERARLLQEVRKIEMGLREIRERLEAD